jgi:opacity protein-like surface antigen
MKNTNRLMLNNTALAVLTVAALAIPAKAADLSPFVRAEAALTDTGYNEDFFQPEGFEFGTAITVGVRLGANDQHGVSLTSGYTKWEGERAGGGISLLLNDEVEQIPLLVNYRYNFGVTEKLTLSLGPTAGFIHEEATTNVYLNTGVPNIKPVGSYSDTDWKTAFGGTIGLSYKLTSAWELTASAQILEVSSSVYSTAGVGPNDLRPYDSATRVSYTLGVGFSW